MRDPLTFAMDGARCVGRDPDDYFYQDDERFAPCSKAERKHIMVLRTICMACPVLGPCREYVDEAREASGFWAGETQSERKQRWAREARERRAS